MNYNNYRSFSDKSLHEAKQHIANFIKDKLISCDLSKFIKESSYYDDTMKALDLYIDLPSITEKIKFSHRARKTNGNIIDITIKTKSSNNTKCEFDKLIELSELNVSPWYYFYCYFDDELNKITRFIIYDLKKLIQTKEFKDKSIFNYQNDKINTKDGGSHFNCITVQKLIDMDVMCVDCSKDNL